MRNTQPIQNEQKRWFLVQMYKASAWSYKVAVDYSVTNLDPEYRPLHP